MIHKDALLLDLQNGIPLQEHPFQLLGQKYGISAQQVIDYIHECQEAGIVRRIGAVLNAMQFGYQSALCGIAVPSEQLNTIADILKPHAGITHSYARCANPNGSLEPICEDGINQVPNLWFTLSVPKQEFSTEINKLSAQIPYPIRVAHATERFKVQVVLDPKALYKDQKELASEIGEVPFIGTEIIETNASQKALIKRLQGPFPLIDNPWKQIASELGNFTESEILQHINEWKSKGALRRIGILARHQKMGFQANAMCVWNVSESQISTIGKKLATRKEITHCYRRNPFAGFNYNLYAMIHARDMDTLKSLSEELSSSISTPLGHLFVSAQEFKKTSLVVFA